MSLAATVICGHKDKIQNKLGIMQLWQTGSNRFFSKTYHFHQLQKVGYVSSCRLDLSPVDWALSPIRQLLVTTKTECNLLHFFGYFCVLTIVVLCRCGKWVRLFVPFFSQQLAWYSLVPQKLHCRKEAFILDEVRII